MSTTLKVLAGLLILAALVLAGLAARLALQPPAPAPSPAAAAAAATHAVVVTARAVPAGRVFTADDLQVQQLPLRPAGAFQDPAALVGLRSALDLGAGVPVLESLTSSGLAQRVAAGERAVAVRIDEIVGVGHRVRPGDLVDLFLVLKNDSREVGATQARLLVPAVRVLGYGDASVDGPAEAAPGQAREGQPRREARTAVLAVPLAQVSPLLLGASAGQLNLALRHPDDRELPAPALVQWPPATPLPRGSTPAAADLAAAGVRLDHLGGAASAAAARPRAPAVAARATVPRRNPSAARPGATATDRVEILRPGGRESIAF